MDKLNLYQDQDQNEFLALITDPESEAQIEDDPDLRLVDSIILKNGDVTAWPTNRLFSQDMFK